MAKTNPPESTLSKHNGIWTTDGGQAFTVPVNTNLVKDPKKSHQCCFYFTGLVFISLAGLGILVGALSALVSHKKPLLQGRLEKIAIATGYPDEKCSVDRFFCGEVTGSWHKCIPLSFVCDGVKDCSDARDERDCANKSPARKRIATVPAVLRCLQNGQFLCSLFGRCIESKLVCDGTPDCYDGEDEQGCDRFCGVGEVQCPTAGVGSGRECISSAGVCDGKVDCGDGWDEHSDLCSMETDGDETYPSLDAVLL